MSDYFDHIVPPSWWQTVTPVNYGSQSCTPGHAFGPHIRNYYLLHFIMEGQGSFTTADTQYTLQQGDIFVIHPGERTLYCASREDPWKYCWLGFEAGQELEFLRPSVIRNAPVRRIFETVQNCENDPNADGRIFSLLYELLWKLSGHSDLGAKSANSYALYARTYLETMYMRPVSIQQIADILHINRRYLTGVFRQTYGVPPQLFLMELRLNKAREFLGRGCSVAEAALLAGFTDASNFSKQYKAHFGVPAIRHRKGADSASQKAFPNTSIQKEDEV